MADPVTLDALLATFNEKYAASNDKLFICEVCNDILGTVKCNKRVRLHNNRFEFQYLHDIILREQRAINLRERQQEANRQQREREAHRIQEQIDQRQSRRERGAAAFQREQENQAARDQAEAAAAFQREQEIQAARDREEALRREREEQAARDQAARDQADGGAEVVREQEKRQPKTRREEIFRNQKKQKHGPELEELQPSPPRNEGGRSSSSDDNRDFGYGSGEEPRWKKMGKVKQALIASEQFRNLQRILFDKYRIPAISAVTFQALLSELPSQALTFPLIELEQIARDTLLDLNFHAADVDSIFPLNLEWVNSLPEVQQSVMSDMKGGVYLNLCDDGNMLLEDLTMAASTTAGQ